MNNPQPDRRWYQFSLRTLLFGVFVVSLLASYGGCYYRLSRRGMAEMAEQWGGTEGVFFYAPMDSDSWKRCLQEHERRRWFFAPANWVDRVLFGGPSPYRGGIWKLTRRDVSTCPTSVSMQGA
jgi:hypothetical protein